MPEKVIGDIELLTPKQLEKDLVEDFIQMTVEARNLLADRVTSLESQLQKTQQALKQIYELLEEQQPPWYLSKHSQLIRETLQL